MRQLILDLLPESPPTLDNFVAGGNAETLAALTGWLAGARTETSFCLWGEAGSGPAVGVSQASEGSQSIV